VQAFGLRRHCRAASYSSLLGGKNAMVSTWSGASSLQDQGLLVTRRRADPQGQVGAPIGATQASPESSSASSGSSSARIR
jgi:hypothetical protein